ncbi:MAG: hypothetical protein ACI9U2_005172 [Bradymonadia bacterium]|jgi:hypothetical protein
MSAPLHPLMCACDGDPACHFAPVGVSRALFDGGDSRPSLAKIKAHLSI